MMTRVLISVNHLKTVFFIKHYIPVYLDLLSLLLLGLLLGTYTTEVLLYPKFALLGGLFHETSKS